jgi:hypothetical protein
MHPWPFATEMRPGPGNSNALRWTASQFEQNGVSSDAQLRDDGPSQHWPERDPVAAKQAFAAKLPKSRQSLASFSIVKADDFS